MKKLITVLSLLSVLNAQQTTEPRIIDLSRLRFHYEVPHNVIQSLYYGDLSNSDPSWVVATKDKFPWCKVQYVSGWYNSSLSSGIFVGFQAPVHRLRENEYITNWLISLQESSNENVIFKGETRFLAQLNWQIFEIQSPNGDGLFVSGGTVPTVMFLAITQLEPVESSHVYPLILVYGGAPIENRDTLFSTITNFLKTVGLGQGVNLSQNTLSTQEIDHVDSIVKPKEAMKLSYISVKKSRSFGVGYTRYSESFQGLTFKFLKGLRTELSLYGFATIRDSGNYEYHVVISFEPFEIRLKSPVYLGFAISGKYFRSGNWVYGLTFPLKSYLGIKGITVLAPMFGITYLLDDRSRTNRHTVSVSWGIQIIF